MSALPGVVSALIAPLFALACGGSAAPPSTASGAPGAAGPTLPVHRFLPLEDDFVYAYDTSSDRSAERGVLMMHVTRPHAGMVSLQIGQKTHRLELAPQGVRYLAGGWILRAPLALGATWRGEAGTVRISAVDKAVDVPAGKFVGCVETVEETDTGVSRRKVTTTFCPDVGIAALDAEASIDGDLIAERALLRSFGKRIDLSAE